MHFLRVITLAALWEERERVNKQVDTKYENY